MIFFSSHIFTITLSDEFETQSFIENYNFKLADIENATDMF
jgi:hypothetical protein